MPTCQVRRQAEQKHRAQHEQQVYMARTFEHQFMDFTATGLVKLAP